MQNEMPFNTHKKEAVWLFLGIKSLAVFIYNLTSFVWYLLYLLISIIEREAYEGLKVIFTSHGVTPPMI